jgi:hypothetical protein
MNTFSLLIGLINKMVTKYKIMEDKVETIYKLLNETVIHDEEKKYQIFKE